MMQCGGISNHQLLISIQVVTLFRRWRKMPIPGRVDKKRTPDRTRSIPVSLKNIQLHLVHPEGTGPWSNPNVAIEKTIEKENTSASPSKLFVVTLLGRNFKEPYFVKEALQTLGFEGIEVRKCNQSSRHSNDESKKFYPHPKMSNIIVVKNTAYYNRLLWLCKHLVCIKPITFPDGMPNSSHMGCTFLNNYTGELRITGSKQNFNHEEIQSHIINPSHVKSTLYKRYALYDLGTEYFPTKIKYKYDLDKPGVVLQPSMYDKDEDDNLI
ncbi:hypothetical protein GJ496_006818 [Pomphorhynchus laevis]|nr:hypothetical protein GJ496_006818 [Pomphorhynchus laevis]